MEICALVDAVVVVVAVFAAAAAIGFVAVDVSIHPLLWTTTEKPDPDKGLTALIEV